MSRLLPPLRNKDVPSDTVDSSGTSSARDRNVTLHVYSPRHSLVTSSMVTFKDDSFRPVILEGSDSGTQRVRLTLISPLPRKSIELIAASTKEASTHHGNGPRGGEYETVPSLVANGIAKFHELLGSINSPFTTSVTVIETPPLAILTEGE